MNTFWCVCADLPATCVEMIAAGLDPVDLCQFGAVCVMMMHAARAVRASRYEYRFAIQLVFVFRDAFIFSVLDQPDDGSPGARLARISSALKVAADRVRFFDQRITYTATDLSHTGYSDFSVFFPLSQGLYLHVAYQWYLETRISFNLILRRDAVADFNGRDILMTYGAVPTADPFIFGQTCLDKRLVLPAFFDVGAVSTGWTIPRSTLTAMQDFQCEVRTRFRVHALHDTDDS